MGRIRTIIDRNAYSKNHYREGRDKGKEIDARIKARVAPRGRWDCDHCNQSIKSQVIYVTAKPKKQYHYWCFKMRRCASVKQPVRFLREAPYRAGMALLFCQSVQFPLHRDVARAEGDG